LTESTPIEGFFIGHTRNRGRETVFVISEDSPFENSVIRCEVRGYKGNLPKFAQKIRLENYQVKNEILVLNSLTSIEVIEGDFLNEIINLADYTSDIYQSGIYTIVGNIIDVSLVRDRDDDEKTLPLYDSVNRQLNLKIRLQDEDGDVAFKIKKLKMLSELLQLPEAEILSTIKEIDSDLEAVDLLALELLDRQVLAIGEGAKVINEGREDEVELSTPFLTFHRFGGV